MNHRESTTELSALIRRDFHLIIQGSPWQQTLRQLLLGDREFAVGRLRWRNTPQAHELLCDNLQATSLRPSGRLFSPNADWLCFTLVSGPQDLRAGSVRGLLSDLAPEPDQTVAMLVLARNDSTWWNALVWHAKRIHPVARIDVVGPRMVRLAPEPEELKTELRWSRTIGALGSATHRRLRQATVTLVGCGRNGLLAAQYVSALGVQHLRLLDPDQLGPENLDAMPAIPFATIGCWKVDAVAELLHQFRPDLSLSLSRASTVSNEGSEFLAHRSDLLISCVDNDTARLAISRQAMRTITVHLDMATSVQREPAPLIHGDARLLLPGHGCVVCVGSMLDFEAARYQLDAPSGSLPLRTPQPWHEQRAGSLLTINAITVAAGVQLWLDLISGSLRHSFWQRLRWSPGSGLESDAAEVDQADDCRFCRP